ncbi:hypothetical protein, partial [Gluconacetobacter diazotrophicus]|uniref:hypothetical protein n=1 Tax=Gluconacetobacter diazotrophicus TaxID=33996 RepID=UPI001C96DAA3
LDQPIKHSRDNQRPGQFSMKTQGQISAEINSQDGDGSGRRHSGLHVLIRPEMAEYDVIRQLKTKRGRHTLTSRHGKDIPK